MRIILVLAILTLTACTAPSQHNEARWGAVRVFFAPSQDGVWDWSQTQRSTLRSALTAANALGPTFVEATDSAHADIVLRDWDSTDCSLGSGRWYPGTNVIEVNPTCVAGLELQAAAIHELGHVLRMTHICMEGGELMVCSPVGIGPAVMNPRVSYGDVLDMTGATPYTGVAQDTPTDLDLAEWRRTHP